MPLSFQASSAARAVHGTVATMAAGGVSADTPIATGPGNSFIDLLQVFVPSETSGTGDSSEVSGTPKQIGSSALSQPRTHKSVADAPDAVAQMLSFQLPIPASALPMVDLASSHLLLSDASQQFESETMSNNDAASQQALSAKEDLRDQPPIAAETTQEHDSSAMPIQAVLDFVLSSPDRASRTGVAVLPQQPADRSAVTNSVLPVSQQQPPAGTVQAAKPAGLGNSIASPAHGIGQQPIMRATAQGFSRPDATAAREGRPVLRLGALNEETRPKGTLVEIPAAPVVPIAGSSLQDLSYFPPVQAGVANQGTPAVTLDVQMSSDDGSSGGQDGTDSGTSADRKGNPASNRLSMSKLNGDNRVGMSGWIASAPHLGNPSGQGESTDVPLLNRSSGMTNLSVDRIAAGSSARRLTNALRSDMNFGVQTEAFGKINIQAALHGDQLASQISLEHAHLHASTLAAHLPGLELRLEDKFQLDATVTVRDAGVASSNQHSSSQENKRHDTPAAPQQNLAVSTKNTTPASLPQTAPTQRATLLSRTDGRLDLLI